MQSNLQLRQLTNTLTQAGPNGEATEALILIALEGKNSRKTILVTGGMGKIFKRTFLWTC